MQSRCSRDAAVSSRDLAEMQLHMRHAAGSGQRDMVEAWHGCVRPSAVRPLLRVRRRLPRRPPRHHRPRRFQQGAGQRVRCRESTRARAARRQRLLTPPSCEQVRPARGHQADARGGQVSGHDLGCVSPSPRLHLGHVSGIGLRARADGTPHAAPRRPRWSICRRTLRSTCAARPRRRRSASARWAPCSRSSVRTASGSRTASCSCRPTCPRSAGHGRR